MENYKKSDRDEENELFYTENHTTHYSNSVQLEVSYFDFKLVFGLNSVKDNKLKVEQFETIIITPQHARELAKVLVANIAKYEKDFMPLINKQENQANNSDTSNTSIHESSEENAE